MAYKKIKFWKNYCLFSWKCWQYWNKNSFRKTFNIVNEFWCNHGRI